MYLQIQRFILVLCANIYYFLDLNFRSLFNFFLFRNADPAFNNFVIFFTEPGTAPRNVQVRPLSSSTMVIQWDEPETPNGQVTVSLGSQLNLRFNAKEILFVS